MWSLAMKVRARNKPISSVPDRAKCQETGISALGWLRGLERREGRLPLSSGPRASLPALAGRGAASGVAWVLHKWAVSHLLWSCRRSRIDKKAKPEPRAPKGLEVAKRGTGFNSVAS